MDRIKLSYQSTIFGDFSSITTSADTIKILLDELSAYSMIPTTFDEIKVFPDGRQQQSQRISFNNNETGFVILFGLDKLDIIQQMTNESGTNIDNMNIFIEKVEKILISISSKFPQTKLFNRLALVSNYFMNIDSIQDKDNVFRNLIIDPFNQNSKEWSLKIVHHLNSTSFDEIINNIITIDRIQGQMLNQNKIKEFDDIKVSIDINTDDKISSLKFDIQNAFSFFKEAIDIHDNTLLKIEEKIKV